MKSIKELFNGKPSLALQATIDGLKTQFKRYPLVQVDTICGCGKFLTEDDAQTPYICLSFAMCALQEATKKTITLEGQDDVEPSTRMIGIPEFLGFTQEDIDAFRDAINGVVDHPGSLHELFDFFGIEYLSEKEMQTETFYEVVDQIEEPIIFEEQYTPVVEMLKSHNL